MKNIILKVFTDILAIVILILIGSGLIEIFWIGDEPKGLTYFALGIAFYSVRLAIISNEKMKAIATAHFLDIVDKFEDNRILYKQHPRVRGLEDTVWKARRYIEYASELIKWVDAEHHDDLAKHFFNLYEGTGIDWESDVIELAYLKNMYILAETLLKFDINNDNRNTVEDINNIFHQLHDDLVQRTQRNN